MLDRQLRGVPAEPAAERLSGNGEVGLPQVIAFWRRQRLPMMLTAATMLLLGAAYLALATPLYTATTSLLIDTRKLAIFAEGDVFGQETISNANLETQIQLLMSGRIAEVVARKLDLAHDTDFMKPPPQSPISTLVELVSELTSGQAPTSAPVDESVLLARAAAILRSGLTVRRVGLSYVINVSYTSEDRYKAAEIANAYTTAYVEDLFNAQLASAQRGSDWLLARIADLRERVTDESLAPQEKSALRTTYDSFLQRYTELVQKQSLPSTEARVITPATPGSKTSPNLLLVLGASLVFGGALGFGVGLIRDLLDRSVRTQQQVETATGATFLGYLPTVNLRKPVRWIGRRSKKRVDTKTQVFTAEPAYSLALTAPFSHFTETLRTIKLASEKASAGQAMVLGITSSMPNEGKTTVAINLARLIAQSGGRVLLIDGDLRAGGLSRSVLPPEIPGLVQLVQGKAKLSQVIWFDQATTLQLLPTGTTAKLSNTNEILASAGTQRLLEACRRQYDAVVVDLPAVLPVVDARAVAHLLNGFVFIVEWGSTTEDILTQAFHLDGVADKVIGVALNKVKLSALKRYQDRATAIVADKYLESYRHVA